jgi:hypothetical protein
MSDEKAILMAFGGTLIAFKVITSVMIVAVFPSWKHLVIVLALNGFWFLPLLYYVPRHLHVRYRLWNVRLRRHRFVAQEWKID